MGFTGDYITGVWFGNDDNTPMKKVTGGGLPAQLWHNVMLEAEAKLPQKDLLADAPGEIAQAPSPAEPAADGDSQGDLLGDLIRNLTGKSP
jgi:penicillin-binding protein 1A